MSQRLGINLTLRDDRPLSEVIEFIQRMEHLGYDSVWTGESWGRDLFTMLTYIAANTSRIQVCAGIANVYSRTPALLAQTVSTLDEVSNGRAVLGLGSSGERVIQDWHGVPYTKPLQRTREYIEIINLALSGSRVNYDGEFYSLRDFRLAVKSQREHIPIFIASVGRKNVELTGELADGWAPIYLSAKHMDKFRTWLDEGASRSKRSSNVIEVRPYTIVCVSDDIRIAKALAKGHLAFYIGGMGRYYHDLVARYGYVEETAAIKDFFAKHERGKAADAVTDAMLSELAVVGTAEQCRQQIVDLQGAGMGSPVLYIPNGSPQEVWSDTIEGLSPRSFR